MKVSLGLGKSILPVEVEGSDGRLSSHCFIKGVSMRNLK